MIRSEEALKSRLPGADNLSVLVALLKEVMQRLEALTHSGFTPAECLVVWAIKCIFILPTARVLYKNA